MGRVFASSVSRERFFSKADRYKSNTSLLLDRRETFPSDIGFRAAKKMGKHHPTIKTRQGWRVAC